MELDRKQLQVSYAIPQGWETVENGADRTPYLEPRRSEYLTFCHEQAPAVKLFRVLTKNLGRGRSVSID